MAKKILLVDDEKDFTELTGTLLQFHDLNVDTINDPIAVAESLGKNKYDLIVTDLMMPGLNGFELITQLRQKTDYARTPVVVILAKILTDDERKQLLKNDVHFIMKPFEPETLVDLIVKLLPAS